MRSGGFAAAACVACCAPPIIATLGVVVGLAATVGVFLGLAAAILALLLGGSAVATRVRRARSARRDASCAAPVAAVAVAAPVRRRIVPDGVAT